MSDLKTDRDDLLDLAWGFIARKDSARLWSLATIGFDGSPDMRSVVLRAADRNAETLSFHTDLRSIKVAQINAEPRASILCWIPEADLQIRMKVQVTVRSGAEVNDLWHDVPDHARSGYGAEPAPSEPIDGPDAYLTTSDQAAFADLECRVQMIDLLHLGTSHQRAIYSHQDDWAGQWVAP